MMRHILWEPLPLYEYNTKSCEHLPHAILHSSQREKRSRPPSNMDDFIDDTFAQLELSQYC
jgi:hypothetical protein